MKGGGAKSIMTQIQRLAAKWPLVLVLGHGLRNAENDKSIPVNFLSIEYPMDFRWMSDGLLWDFQWMSYGFSLENLWAP